MNFEVVNCKMPDNTTKVWLEPTNHGGFALFASNEKFKCVEIFKTNKQGGFVFSQNVPKDLGFDLDPEGSVYTTWED